MALSRWILTLPLLALASVGVAKDEEDDGPRLSADTLSGLELRNIGPALMSGRIADIAIHPQRQSTWYVAAGSGNLWKTTNAGTTWESIFDDQGSYSIGCITLDPNRPETLWLGSGENVSGRHVGYGDGVYRSLDGGKNWENMGLAESEHIGRIVVDPRDSNIVMVAAQGPLWSKGGQRGLFRTIDGGATWDKVLGEGEYTGVNEVLMDPVNPDVLYASTHQRLRSVAALVNGGPGTGIHKSTDGGLTWRQLTTGLPEEDKGRIGLAISPQQPQVVYATIELANREGGFWRSEDAGETWEKRSEYVSGGTGPHYYQEIFASPHAFDRVYQMDVRLHVTHDGGSNFAEVPHEFKHSDNHALAFNPNDPQYLLSGVDGGVYESFDLGKTWRFISNLPITQFYKVAVDYDEPFYNLYGGTQDNNTQGGPSRTNNVHGIRNSDWFVTLFGDGHQPASDPSNADIVYSEWQQGNLVRYDRRNGEIVYIQPQPGPGEPNERFNWDAPILVSPHDPKTLYFASARVWRSDDRGDSWRAISPDLTRQIDRFKTPIMGRVQSIDTLWDVYAMSMYSTITSLAQSPLNAQVLYAGTDDGLIQISGDGGENWTQVDSLPGVKDGFFVNDIKADLHDENTVYVAVDQHKNGDFAPYLFKSNNKGRSWRSITGDLPERHLVWRVVQDHVNPALMFAGTEFGVFFTIDGGGKWIELKGGVPQIPFRDLAIQRREQDLVGATFGRGFFILDDYSPLREVSEEMLNGEVHLFKPRDAKWYIERRPLGGDTKASQGDAFYTAPNPPFGAVFTYYLGEELKSKKAQRKEAEKKRIENKQNTPSPGFDALREEELEDAPAIILTVTDSNGDAVSRISGPVEKGFHRVAWDLRYPNVAPWTGEEGGDDFFAPAGVLAMPGTYTVSLSRRVDGKETSVGDAKRFEVVPVREATLTANTSAQVLAFAERTEMLTGQAQAADASIKEALVETGAIRTALLRARNPAQPLYENTLAIERELKTLQLQLNGDPRREVLNTPGAASVSDRLFAASIGKRFSAYGPTPTHRMVVDIAQDQLGQIRNQLTALREQRLPALRKALDAAGVPWTPGR